MIHRSLTSLTSLTSRLSLLVIDDLHIFQEPFEAMGRWVNFLGLIQLIWLVVWNLNFMTSPTRLGVMIQSDKLIFFRGVQTTN
jgi:hypothetical protein